MMPTRVADFLDVLQDVTGHEYGHLASQVRQEVEDVVPAGRVQRAGGLVEEEDLGAVHQRLRQVQPLAHSARIAGDAAAGGF